MALIIKDGISYEMLDSDLKEDVGRIDETADTTAELKQQFTNLIIDAGNNNSEIVTARGSYTILNDRLNACDKTVLNNTVLANNTNAEVTEARNSYATLNDRLNACDRVVERIAGSQTSNAELEKKVTELEDNFNTAVSNVLLQMQNYYNKIYPVGTILEFTEDIDPNTLFGSKWIRYGLGKVLIGGGTVTDGSGNTKTFTEGDVGGEINHILTIDEMPTHNHSQVITANTGGSIKGRTDYGTDSSTMAKYNQGVTTSNEGGGLAHNNLQPYVVVYRWKRTELATSEVTIDDVLTEHLLTNIINTENIANGAITLPKINESALAKGVYYDIGIDSSIRNEYSNLYLYIEEPNYTAGDGLYTHHYSFNFTPDTDIYCLKVGVRKDTTNVGKETLYNLVAGVTYVFNTKWTSESPMNAIWIKAESKANEDGTYPDISLDGSITNFRFSENNSNCIITKTRINNVDNSDTITLTKYSDNRLATRDYVTEEYKVQHKNVSEISNLIDLKTINILNSEDVAETRLAYNIANNAVIDSTGANNKHFLSFNYTPNQDIDIFRVELLRGDYKSNIIYVRDLKAGTTYTYNTSLLSQYKATHIKFCATAKDATAKASLDGVITDLMFTTNEVSGTFTNTTASNSKASITIVTTSENNLISKSYLDFKLKELEQKLTGNTTYTDEELMTI